MIIHMNNTSSAAVGLRMEELRDTVGSVALGRVLTLVIIANDSAGIRDGMQAAAGASRAHPCRIVAIHAVDADEPQLDAEIRVGAEAGLSEIAILRCSGGAGSDLETVLSPLILPDTPIVAWWVQDVPERTATTAVGSLAQRRITTSRFLGDPIQHLCVMRDTYTPGDTDLAWAGMTLWRNHLAAMLDEPPEEPVLSVTVEGASEHPSTYLLAGWLALHLQVPVTIDRHQGAVMTEVSLHRESGDLRLVRPLGSEIADMIRPGRQTQRVNLPVRTMETMLIEELRSMTADVAYGEVLQNGLPLLDIPEFQR
ncbi:glucose-6-phosphate dehydrogenase assembly protein OpcA [Ancrocorticia populi]|uniref:glucose-6-phosphate dehydrogenase assembly protein OpcA n=2 Tax=Ancrocorticia populi TaxID=2175228 RepID=UPI003F8E81D3